MLTESVVRLDAKSGKMTEYHLPRSTNIRRVSVQETGPRPVLSADRHAPISVRRIVLYCCQGGHLRAIGREMANRIGRGGIPGKREGLAAAAAEVLVAPRAAYAGLFHPCGAAKGVECRRECPDFGQRVGAHRPEFKTRDALRRMARQHFADRRHVERPPTPAPHARLGIAGVVVGHHGVDDDGVSKLARCGSESSSRCCIPAASP